MTAVKKHIALIMLITIIISVFFAPGQIMGAESRKNAILIVIDKVTLTDLCDSSYPNIRKLMDIGAVGIMNNIAAGENNSESAYLTIGSGSKLNGNSGALAFNPNEFYEGTGAGQVYQRRTGYKPSTGGVLHIGLAPMLSANNKLKYDFTTGYLGKALHQNNLFTGVLGNADTEKEFQRQIATVAMDEKGRVDYGDVSRGLLLKDPYAITGWRTDYNKLFTEFKNLKKKADFIAIETGDTARIDSAMGSALKSVLNRERIKSLTGADAFLGNVMKELDLNRDLLMLVTPSPSTEANNAANNLTPIVVAGPGIKPGLAISGTTRRAGLVSNIDIAATVLNFFGLPQPSFLNGQPIYSITDENPTGKLIKQNQQIVFNHKTRTGILVIYRNYLIIVALLAFLAQVVEYKKKKRLKPFLLAGMAIPAAILLLPLLPRVNAIVNIIELTALIVLICWIATILARKSVFNQIVIMGFLTTALLSFDVLLNSPLIKTSAMGYDPVSGARYYGIGNEYMGVLIGSLIIAASVFTGRLKKYRQFKYLLALLFIFVIYIMAAPDLGTNAGGTIAAVSAFTITFMSWHNVKFNQKNITLAVIGVLAATALFIILGSVIMPSSQSHIGRTITLIRDQGLNEIANIIIRKESVNLNLIRRTQWTWLYGLNLAIVLFILYRKRYQGFFARHPYFRYAMRGLIVGSITALVFNDSGIVAAGTMIPYASFPLLLAVIDDND